jgi:isopropylmalate/homocitrate/citramalate synthase
MISLIRKYTQSVSTYAAHKPHDDGKEYIANIVRNDSTGRIVSKSISVDGYEVEDEDEKQSILDLIEQYEATENKTKP